MSRSPKTLSLIPLVCLAGCMVGPDYQPPETVPDGTWIDASAESDRTVPAAWWRGFDDPVLSELVEKASAGNIDIAIAAERTREARALSRAAGSRLYPRADAIGSTQRRRQSENGPLPLDRIPELEAHQTIYDARLDVAWEVDLFGRNRRAAEAAGARAEATEADRRAVVVSVTGEVARNYFELRGAQAELAARQEAVEAAQRSLELARVRVAAGESPAAETLQAESRLKALEALLPQARARRDRAAMAIALLLGETPESRLALTRQPTAMPQLGRLPVGERADLLRRRPDIRAAERRLAAATADVGVAQGALYPQLSFSADGGYQSLDGADLVDYASRAWSVAPLISWQLFDGGRVRAEIAAAESRLRRSALAYERVVLAALSEAEQAMATYRHGLETVRRQREAWEALGENRDLTEIRYRAGEVVLSELLDAEQAVADSAASLARAQTQAAAAMTLLYKSLGGGWQKAGSQNATDTEISG